MEVCQPIDISFSDSLGALRSFKGVIVDVAESEGLVLRNTVQVSITNKVINVETNLESDDTAIIAERKCYFKKFDDGTWTVSFSDFRDA